MNDGERSPTETRLDGLSRSVDDVREELHTRLADMRQMVEQGREAMFRMESVLATSDPAASLRVAEIVDGVRAIAERTRRRQSVLIGVVVAQALMLLIAIGLLAAMRGDVQRGPVISSDVTVESKQTLSAVDDNHVAATPRTATEPQTTASDDTAKHRRRHRSR